MLPNAGQEAIYQTNNDNKTQVQQTRLKSKKPNKKKKKSQNTGNTEVLKEISKENIKLYSFNKAKAIFSKTTTERRLQNSLYDLV